MRRAGLFHFVYGRSGILWKKEPPMGTTKRPKQPHACSPHHAHEVEQLERVQGRRGDGQHADRGSGEDASAPIGVLPRYVRFTDLVGAGIVANWQTLLRLIENENFPEGVMLGRNMRAWRLDSVEEWLDQRPSARKQIPEKNR